MSSETVNSDYLFVKIPQISCHKHVCDLLLATSSRANMAFTNVTTLYGRCRYTFNYKYL